MFNSATVFLLLPTLKRNFINKYFISKLFIPDRSLTCILRLGQWKDQTRLNVVSNGRVHIRKQINLGSYHFLNTPRKFFK